MTFGIREKVSLLVVCAAAASAILVARGVAQKSLAVLREHEIVDLGDEASLQGWTLSDKVDGLAEDLMNLAFSPEFHDAVNAGIDREGLAETARKYCRRYWNDYLHIDIVRLDGDEFSFSEIHTPVKLDHPNAWLPDIDSIAGAQLHLSPIQRIEVVFPQEGEREEMRRGVPVIWGLAPLNRFPMAFAGPQNYIRIVTNLDTQPRSRQFYVLENEAGEQLQRADELVPPGEGNDEVFRRLSQDPVLRLNLAKEMDSSSDQNQPRVERLVKKEWVKLDKPYYFLEGIPGKDLALALSFDSSGEYFDDLNLSTGHIGRVGGLSGGVKELRLLADSPDKLEILKEKSIEVLRRNFPQEYDKITWREVVHCDEIHAWAVQLLIGAGENLDRYLIHYAVMEDELASSIQHEMRALRRNAFVIAGGAGILAFLIAMLFIRPLKAMTKTAQKITTSGDDNLHNQLKLLANNLAIKRRDEVGDIARASKRLFEEVIESQEKLEQRVSDRTSDLRKVNYDLEQANVKLRSLSHEKDAFVAKVSHDLRQPLNAIFLQVEALKLTELDGLQKQDVEKIHQHATRELNLVNDILEYQKIIMGAETLIRNDIDIESFAKDLHVNFLADATEKGLDLELTCPEAIGRITADERRLRQILGNLVGNACKFTKEGKVEIKVESRTVRGEDWVEFSVIDTGRGMSPDEQAKAFVPFVSNKKDNAGGTGLGLSICKELTERMGGKIGFVSEFGSGTSFSVLIPRIPTSEHYEVTAADGDFSSPAAQVSTPQEAAEKIAIHAENSRGGAGARVLVIDDDPSVRLLLTRILEGDGYQVITAGNGDEGLEIARREKPEAITLDVVMPGEKDGWAVLKELKASPETDWIPVIMVSIMAEADNGFALDVEDYLVKPVDVDRLSRVVSRVTKSALQRNLLIVDDDVDSTEALARLLKDSGWSSSLASNGLEALQVLKKTRPAAIVLDLMMPEMDGFEFLKVIQEDENLASIPIIVMTGKEPTDAERGFLENRVGMILKKGDDSGSQQVLKTITQRIRPRSEIDSLRN
ncbi:MAG: response regulator [Verrucomicrobiales bacterium]|nr:response regulator [Verrucomicrobiales bacterium]